MLMSLGKMLNGRGVISLKVGKATFYLSISLLPLTLASMLQSNPTIVPEIIKNIPPLDGGVALNQLKKG